MIELGQADVLLVVDVQYSFTPGGSLAVPEGDCIIAPINRLAARFSNVVLTQDWHPPDHISFASQHPGKQAFEVIELPYGKQVLWPDHCVQGTSGADLHEELRVPNAQLIIRKGFRRDVDSYSAFVEADGKTPTGLNGYLRTRGLERIFLAGLATDFCVAWSALDARKHGFTACVVEDATRGIDIDGSLADAWHAMASAGVGRIRSSAIGVA